MVNGVKKKAKVFFQQGIKALSFLEKKKKKTQNKIKTNKGVPCWPSG